MTETIKATELTRLRVEDELGSDVVVHGMVRIYMHPGLYMVSRYKHGPSPTERTIAMIGQNRPNASQWHVWVDEATIVPNTYISSHDTLVEAQQVAILELLR